MNTGPLGLCVPSWPGFALQQEGKGNDALGSFITRLPMQCYMPAGRVDRAQDEQEFCLLCFHMVLCNFFILMFWVSPIGIL